MFLFWFLLWYSIQCRYVLSGHRHNYFLQPGGRKYRPLLHRSFLDVYGPTLQTNESSWSKGIDSWWVTHQLSMVKVYLRQTWNFRSHAVSACIGLWSRRLMHAPHRLMHACTACIAPWSPRLMHAVTAWALLFWFQLGYTFISSYFANKEVHYLK